MKKHLACLAINVACMCSGVAAARTVHEDDSLDTDMYLEQEDVQEFEDLYTSAPTPAPTNALDTMLQTLQLMKTGNATIYNLARVIQDLAKSVGEEVGDHPALDRAKEYNKLIQCTNKPTRERSNGKDHPREPSNPKGRAIEPSNPKDGKHPYLHKATPSPTKTIGKAPKPPPLDLPGLNGNAPKAPPLDLPGLKRGAPKPPALELPGGKGNGPKAPALDLPGLKGNAPKAPPLELPGLKGNAPKPPALNLGAPKGNAPKPPALNLGAPKAPTLNIPGAPKAPALNLGGKKPPAAPGLLPGLFGAKKAEVEEKPKTVVEKRCAALLDMEDTFATNRGLINSSSNDWDRQAQARLVALFEVAMPTSGDGQQAKKQEAPKEDEGKQYEAAVVQGEKQMSISILRTAVDKELAKNNIPDYDTYVERFLAGDRDVIGFEDATQLAVLMNRVSHTLTSEMLNTLAIDPVFDAPKEEFDKQFKKGVAPNTKFARALATRLDKNPFFVAKCILGKADVRETMARISDGHTNLLKYYQEFAPRMIGLLSSGAVKFVISLMQIMTNLSSKPQPLQSAYTMFERSMKNVATLEGLKDPLVLRETRKPRAQVVVPWLFVANLLNDESLRLRPNLKSKDKGAWSPNFIDVFIDVVQGIPDGQGNNETLQKSISSSCKHMLADAWHKQPPGSGDSITQYKVWMKDMKDDISKCQSNVPETVEQDYKALEEELQVSDKKVTELVDLKQTALVGIQTDALPFNESGIDWDKVRPVLEKEEKEVLNPSGDKGTTKQLRSLAAFFEDATLRQELHLFCTLFTKHLAEHPPFVHAGEEEKMVKKQR